MPVLGISKSDEDRHSRVSNFEVNSLIWLKFKLVRDFMAVLLYLQVWQRSDQKWSRYPLDIFSIISLWENFSWSRESNSKLNSPISPKFELRWDFMPVLIICKFDEDPVKKEDYRLDNIFPILSLWELSVVMETCFNPICPKTLFSPSLTLMILRIKFDQDWPPGLWDIQVCKCGRRWTDDGLLLCYKLTLWAYGSGELKTRNT